MKERGKQTTMFPLSPQGNPKAPNRPRTGKVGFNQRKGLKSNIPLPGGKNQMHNIMIKDQQIEVSNYDFDIREKRSPTNLQMDPNLKH